MNVFLEEYKHLEKLCSEMYGQNHGVTLYINDMEQTSGYDRRKIAGWDQDFRRLKQLRHIRNAMVHDTSFDENAYSAEDIVFLQDFYQRIINGNDPLTKKCKLERSVSVSTVSIPKYSFPEKHIQLHVVESSNETKNDNIKAIIIAIIMAAVILLVVIGVMLTIYNVMVDSLDVTAIYGHFKSSYLTI